MDSIKAIKGLSPHMGGIEHLSIFVNGQRLDEFLSNKVDNSFLGLIPAWLNDYDEDFLPNLKEKQYVWEQTKLEGDTKILPILLCPDDFDFSCTVIVVEVIDNNDAVIWNRFGVDTTPFYTDDSDFPPHIGKEVTWFSNIESFIFSKDEYLECVGLFSST